MKTYMNRKCYICGRFISSAGFAWASHRASHEKKAKLQALVERLRKEVSNA